MSVAAARFCSYRLGKTLRHRWVSYLPIVLLIGILGGLALGAVAGARRTESAYPQFLASSNSSALLVTPSATSTSGFLYSPKLTNELAHLPGVERVAASVPILVAPVRPNGAPKLTPALQNNLVASIGSVNGLYYSQDRVVATQGRVPSPGRLGEFAVTAEAASLLHWHVGEVFRMGGFTLSQLTSAGSNTASLRPKVRFQAKLVGIVAFANSVVHDEVDRYPTFALFTPAVTRLMIANKGGFFATYALRLNGGGAEVSRVEREVIGIIPRGSTYTFHVTSVVEAQVERAVKPESIALGVFGAIAGVAALLLAAQAASRALFTSRSDFDILRALGADRAMSTADALAGVVGAVFLGSVIAVLVAVALSPIAPVGTVRQVDPSPGFAWDWTVLGAGFAVLAIGLTTVSILTALRLAPRRLESRTSTDFAASNAVSRASRIGLPTSAVAGLRFALERGRGRSAVPVGSVLAGAVLAVVVVVGTLTFASGLRTLVSHPALFGWNWNYAIEEAGGGNVPPAALRLVEKSPLIGGWGGYGFGDIQLDGQTVPALIAFPGGTVSPPVLSGRGLRAANEIVLGGATLAALGKRVGDTVVGSYGTPKDFPVYVPPRRFLIVGTVTMPAVGPGAQSLHPSMGLGAVISRGVEPATMARALRNPDPNLNGPAIVVLRVRRGVSAAAGLAGIRHIANVASRIVDNDPQSGGGTFEVLPVQQPAEITIYRTIGATPTVLAGALALGAVLALAVTLIASVRRRRRDLAILKSLGFLQRQLAAAVAWQASVAAVVGIVIGIPLGITLGRWLWTLFAHEIYAVPMPTVPVLEVVLVAVGALVLANLVAALPGRVAALTPAAEVLRTE